MDKRGRLQEEVFSHRISKDGTVFLYWQGKQVVTLCGGKAQAFVRDIAGLEGQRAQLLMAKATGNFKRGNEKAGKRYPPKADA